LSKHHQKSKLSLDKTIIASKDNLQADFSSVPPMQQTANDWSRNPVHSVLHTKTTNQNARSVRGSQSDLNSDFPTKDHHQSNNTKQGEKYLGYEYLNGA